MCERCFCGGGGGGIPVSCVTQQKQRPDHRQRSVHGEPKLIEGQQQYVQMGLGHGAAMEQKSAKHAMVVRFMLRGNPKCLLGPNPTNGLVLYVIVSLKTINQAP